MDLVQAIMLIWYGIALIKGILEINPEERMSIDDIMAHPWVTRYVDSLWKVLCQILIVLARPSQIQESSHAALADRLTQSLRQNGDMGVIDPYNGYVRRAYAPIDASHHVVSSNDSRDEDVEMLSASHMSQFTRSILLFVGLID